MEAHDESVEKSREDYMKKKILGESRVAIFMMVPVGELLEELVCCRTPGGNHDGSLKESQEIPLERSMEESRVKCSE